MDSYPQIFISFASEDENFIRTFFYNLKNQNISYWDYSNPEQEIDCGINIQEDLNRRISACDFFIPIISKNSADIYKKYTHAEVEFAIQHQIPIIPILLTDISPPKMICFTKMEFNEFLQRFSLSKNLIKFETIPWNNFIFIDVDRINEEKKKLIGKDAINEIQNMITTWFGAYSLLRDYKAIKINSNDQKQCDEIIHFLCKNYLKIKYIPNFKGDTRLPFSKRFINEIEKYSISTSNHIYVELVSQANEIDHLFHVGDWNKVNDEIDFFIMLCKRKLPDYIFYYPQIAKGVCELQLGNLENAESHFLIAKNHSISDENAFCGLGCSYLNQKRFEESLNEYISALNICSVEAESEIRYNILNIAIQVTELFNQGFSEVYKLNFDLAEKCKGILNDIDFLEKINPNAFPLEDKLKIQKIKAIAYYKSNNDRKAIAILENLYTLPLIQLSYPNFSYLDKINIIKIFNKEIVNKLKQIELLFSNHAIIRYINDKQMHIIDKETDYYVEIKNHIVTLYYRDIAGIIFHFRALKRLGLFCDAEALLKKESTKLDNTNLYHHLANLYAELSKFGKSLEIYKNILSRTERRKRQYLIEYALILKYLGNEAGADDICNNLLNNYFEKPEKDEDFYYDGFASYLLGDIKTAQRDFKRSKQFDKYYDKLIPNHSKRSVFIETIKNEGEIKL